MIGHGLSLSPNTEKLYNQLLNVSKYHQEHYAKENEFLLWFSPIHPVVCVYGAEGVEQVVRDKTYNSKSWMYEFLHSWLGTGLLTGNGGKWAARRKMLTPAFHFEILKNFVEIMNRNAKVLVENIHDELAGKECIEIDMFPKITLCALDIICEAAMGKNINAQSETENNAYIKAVQDSGVMLMGRIAKFWLWPGLIFDTFSNGRALRKNIELMHAFTMQVIKDRIAEKKIEDDSAKESVETIDGKKKLVFLDL